MNLLSLVRPRLDNIYQIRRKWYCWSVWNFLQPTPIFKTELAGDRSKHDVQGWVNIIITTNVAGVGRVDEGVRACAAGPAGAERQRAQCAGLPPVQLKRKVPVVVLEGMHVLSRHQGSAPALAIDRSSGRATSNARGLFIVGTRTCWLLPSVPQLHAHSCYTFNKRKWGRNLRSCLNTKLWR
jgi:hypothetical protein